MRPRDIGSHSYYDRTGLAQVTAVDEANGTVALFLMDHYGIRPKVIIPVVAESSDSWMRYCPQVGDVVHVAYRADDSVIITGYHPHNYDQRVDSYNKNEKNAAGGKGPEMHRILHQGEFDMRAKGGGYLKMDNIGDVQILSLAGKLYLYGREGLTEYSANAHKMWNGKSWMRFGTPFRIFPNLSERELPASGGGSPLPSKSPFVERDVRLYDGEGNLLVHEALGNVMDDTGTIIVSGAASTGKGSTVAPKVTDAIADPVAFAEKNAAALASGSPVSLGSAVSTGREAAEFFAGNVSSLASSLGEQLASLPDQVMDAAKAYVDKLETQLTSIQSGIASIESPGDVVDLIEEIQGFVTGLGLSSDAGPLSGLGPTDKEVRYRMLINKKGEQVYSLEVDEDGGVVMTSESDKGIRFIANKGPVTMHSSDGFKMNSPSLENAAVNNVVRGTEQVKLLAGDTAQIAAPTITQNATDHKRTADATIVDTSVTSHTIKVVTTGGAPLATILVDTSGVHVTTTAGTIDLNASTINITASGTVNISGGSSVVIN